MSLKQVVEKFQSLDIVQTRCVEDDYVEIVISNQQSDKRNQILNEFFGPAIKSAGEKPKKPAVDLTKKYGGIQDNQVLFNRVIEGKNTIAMLWPWMDGIRNTLKIVVVK
jgi:hypothetical protein